MRQILILCLASLLAGCTTLADSLHGALTPPPGMAYAVFSMTVHTYTPERASSTVRWRNLDSQQQGSLTANYATDTVFGEEGMSPVDGRLQLLALPPGRYTLADAYGHWNDEHADTLISTRQRSAHFQLDRTFELRPGETVYLGEIRFNLDNLPDVAFSDARRRDFGHMQRVWKVKDTSSITLRPFNGKAPRSGN